MGCAPSKVARVSDDETRQHLKEIDELRKTQSLQDIEISRLNEENKKLRYGTSYEDVTKLESEMEQLRVENEKLKRKEKETEQLKRILEEENATLKLHSGAGVSHEVPDGLLPKRTKSNLPKVGDRVLAMWELSMWQYFTATIVSFDTAALKYTINWDDQDPSGRVIDYFNLALDRVPEEDEVGLGTIVLFPQGNYSGKEGVRLGGQRWHQGKIGKVTKGPDGIKRYDGQHTKGDADGKWVTFKGFEQTFSGLTRDQLRIAPNVLDILSAETQSRPQTRVGRATGEDSVISPCDVFISYSKIDSSSAVRNKEVSPAELPPSYEEAISTVCDPRDIRDQLNGSGVTVNRDVGGDLIRTVEQINDAKVFIACLSDHYASDEICRQEFQYAKKTAKKTVIPVVIGNSFDWMMTVVGLLVAGELYIHFKDKDIQDMKMNELMNAVKKSVPQITREEQILSSNQQQTEAAAPVKTKVQAPDVFISYCWVNSHTALQMKQIPNLIGSELSDPRKIKSDLTDADLSCWLDVEKLGTAGQGEESMGMFEQIAKGLGTAKVVIVFVSKEYANSNNCRMEFQFALKSLKKPVVPVIVGSGYDWKETVVGLLVSSQEIQPIDLQGVRTQNEYKVKIEEIKKSVKSLLGIKEKQYSYKAPRVGDHVISHHQKYSYFFATIASFDPFHLSYTVDWDDGDPSGRVQSYKDVGLDQVPTPDEIGVDSRVFFPQGSYGATAGNNTGGMRYHEGVVTRTYKDASGDYCYDGHHTRGEADGKWVTYRGYNYDFVGLKLDQLRIAPNAMDALVAFKDACQN